ncbi:diaminopimelate decarboxylase [Rubrivirga sp.]|uniref:diaminopimelate decarboxylase n=1 Tax=Rubrivirga sp. TaxID=1885344 RepID=UPI003C7758F3
MTDPWWRTRRDALLTLADEQTPRYVYDLDTVRAQARALRAAVPAARYLYAVKANGHPDVIRALSDEGLYPECVSLSEIEHVRSVLEVDPADVLYTPNFASRAEVERSLEAGVQVTIDNAATLGAWGEMWAGHDVFVRVDPGVGKGHHAHVRTAGTASKFGVDASDLEGLAAAARAKGVRVVGLHAHVGSGVDETDVWAQTARILASHADAHFPDVRVLDVGGGLPVPTGGASAFDIEAAGRALAAFQAERPEFEIWVEPGRYLVADAGVLVARVTQVKRKGDVRYVGLDAGMNSLVRPALYGAHHDIVNLTRLDEPDLGPAELVGPICETGDAFAHGRSFPNAIEGDVVVIGTAGAYGAVMASHYNRRAPAEEVVLA